MYDLWYNHRSYISRLKIGDRLMKLYKGMLFIIPLLNICILLLSSCNNYQANTFESIYHDVNYNDILDERKTETKANNSDITTFTDDYKQIGEFFRWYENENKMVLMNGNEQIDSMQINFGKVCDWSNFYDSISTFNNCDIPPYFIIKSSFEYTEDDEQYDINFYKIYTAFNNKICEAKYITEYGEIEYITDPFLYGIAKESGFTVYLKEYRYICKNGKYNFTYNCDDNNFYGVFHPHENVEILNNSFEKTKDIIFKLLAGGFETKYTLDQSDYFRDYIYNYSEITEIGYRTESEFLKSLNCIFTYETSIEIYENLISGEYPKIKVVDENLFLRLTEGGGAYAWSFDVYFDFIEKNENFIKADIVFLTRNDSDLFIPEKANESFVIMDNDGLWKTKCAPMIDWMRD